MSPWGELLFRCAICDREIWDCSGRNGRDRHLSPVCRSCEHHWTERVGKPSGGAFMDRRKAMQVTALAEALHSEAASLRWSSEHGRA